MLRRGGILATVLLLALAGTARAQTIQPPFDGSYSWTNLGVPPGVPLGLGGLTFKAGTTDRMLIGGLAAGPDGALYEVGVVRDVDGHITGFSGTATRIAEAAHIDGGLAYGPGDVLFLSRDQQAQIGQSRPGSAITDKVLPLAPLGVTGSLGTLAFVPHGLPGSGSLKLATYPTGAWYDADVVPDGGGTYDLRNVRPGPTLTGAPEGIAYVTAGSPHFSGPSVIVAEYTGDRLAAYDVGGDGDPAGSPRTFLSGLNGAGGAVADPVTGDLLVSTFDGDRVIVVEGFAAPATLAVQAQVVNDDGGVLAPSDLLVHVRQGGSDVPGSPRAGSASTPPYHLAPGTAYLVGVDGAAGYAVSFAGDCAADGSVVAAAGVLRRCTVTADDLAAGRSPLPPPEAGESVNAVPKSGTVKVKVRGSTRFVGLDEARQIPVGSVVDTRKGRVTIVAAGGQSMDFYDGIFRIGQGKGARPLTTLTLVEALSCPKAGRAMAAAKRKKRRLWGDGSGRFRTKGKHSAATVVGTRYLVEDRCTSTLTRVARGRVSVRDFVKRKTVIVKAGKQYVARARR